MSKKLTEYAVALQLEGDAVIAIVPAPSTVLVKRQDAPGARWKDVLDEEAPVRVVKRVAVPLTQADTDALEDSGWSKPLAQKLLRALDRQVTIAKDGSPVGLDLVVQVDIVDHQDTDMKAWVVDGRKSASLEAEEAEEVEDAPVESVEAEKVCSVEDCDNAAVSRGWCDKHYRRWLKHGDPQVTEGHAHNLSQSELVEWCLTANSAWNDGCLIWQGAKSGSSNGAGYAYVGFRGKKYRVTRLILAEQLGVDIDDLDPKTLALHSCDRGHEGCVTPEHIRPGSQLDNVQDAKERARLWQQKTNTCPRGHALVEGNLVQSSLPKRECYTCSVARSRAASRGTELEQEIAGVLADHPEIPVSLSGVQEQHGFLKEYKHRHIEGIEDFELLDYALENRENVLLYGPTQSGKSTLPIAYAEHKGLPVYLLACNVALEPSQIFGKFIPDEEGGFLWSDGPVTKIVRDGGVLVIDEANVASPKIMTTLYPLLDSRREITLLDHNGEVIRAHKDLLIVATCNLGYQGTLPMSEAFLDRFAHRHHWDYSQEVEDKLVKSKTLLETARGIRKEGDIRTPFSTSLLKAFEKLATGKLGWDYAVANLLGRFTDQEDREAVKALIDTRSDKIKIELGLIEPPKPVDPKDAPEKPKTAREWRSIMGTWS